MRGRRFRQEASPDVVLLSRWFSRTWMRFCRPKEWRRRQQQLDDESQVQLQEVSGEGSGDEDEEENDWTEEAYEKEMFLQRESERQRQRLKRLLQLLFLACVITACVLVSTGAFILAHYAADCRLPPLQQHELLQAPLQPMLYVSATGSVVLRVNSSANNNTAFFRMFHFSTEAERLAKVMSFTNSSGLSVSVSEAGGLSQNYMGGYLCSGTDMDIVLPTSAVLTHLSLSSTILGMVNVGLGAEQPFVPVFDSVEIVSVQGARVNAINTSSIFIRSGVGSVMVWHHPFHCILSDASIACDAVAQISNVRLQGDTPKIEILSRGGSVTLNLTDSGFSGVFEVHVSYGLMEIPGHLLIKPAAFEC